MHNSAYIVLLRIWIFINRFIWVIHCIVCNILSKPHSIAASRIPDFFCCCRFTCPQLDIPGHLPPSQSYRTKENVIQGQCQNQPDNWHERLLQPQNFPLLAALISSPNIHVILPYRNADYKDVQFISVRYRLNVQIMQFLL